MGRSPRGRRGGDPSTGSRPRQPAARRRMSFCPQPSLHRCSSSSSDRRPRRAGRGQRCAARPGRLRNIAGRRCAVRLVVASSSVCCSSSSSPPRSSAARSASSGWTARASSTRRSTGGRAASGVLVAQPLTRHEAAGKAWFRRYFATMVFSQDREAVGRGRGPSSRSEAARVIKLLNDGGPGVESYLRRLVRRLDRMQAEVRFVVGEPPRASPSGSCPHDEYVKVGAGHVGTTRHALLQGLPGRSARRSSSTPTPGGRPARSGRR